MDRLCTPQTPEAITLWLLRAKSREEEARWKDRVILLDSRGAEGLPRPWACLASPPAGRSRKNRHYPILRKAMKAAPLNGPLYPLHRQGHIYTGTNIRVIQTYKSRPVHRQESCSSDQNLWDRIPALRDRTAHTWDLQVPMVTPVKGWGWRKSALLSLHKLRLQAVETPLCH